MKKTVLAVLFLLVCACCTPVYAGEVKYVWVQNPDADANATPPISPTDGYRGYFGTASGVYSQARGEGIDFGAPTCDGDPLVPGGRPTCEFDLPSDSLSNCVRYYFSMTAYNTAGESLFSDESTGIARPIVLDAEVVETDEHIKIVGESFGPDLTVQVYGVDFPGAIRVGCSEVRLPTQLLPGGNSSPILVVTLCNDTVCTSETITMMPGQPAFTGVR